jgi:hypothetical protein
MKIFSLVAANSTNPFIFTTFIFYKNDTSHVGA